MRPALPFSQQKRERLTISATNSITRTRGQGHRNWGARHTPDARSAAPRRRAKFMPAPVISASPPPTVSSVTCQLTMRPLKSHALALQRNQCPSPVPPQSVTIILSAHHFLRVRRLQPIGIRFHLLPGKEGRVANATASRLTRTALPQSIPQFRAAYQVQRSKFMQFTGPCRASRSPGSIRVKTIKSEPGERGAQFPPRPRPPNWQAVTLLPEQAAPVSPWREPRRVRRAGPRQGQWSLYGQQNCLQSFEDLANPASSPRANSTSARATQAPKSAG